MSHREHTPRSTRIAVLGCGTVGSEVAGQLLAGRLPGVELVTILVRRAELDRGLPRGLFTTHVEDVLSARPDIIIELIGGLDPAAGLIRSFLVGGGHIITANKTVIAHHGDELATLARCKGGSLAWSAAVGASLPILATLQRLRPAGIRSLRAVLNGTCNFILTRMAASGCTLDDAVALAQSRGLAEPDPAADISGRDSAEKLAILARHAGFGEIQLRSVQVEGITAITPEDHREARAHGQVIKLIAEWNGPATCPDTPGRVPVPGAPASVRPALRVGPALLPICHPLAQLAAEENGALITTDLAGDTFLKGRGAGAKPTAAAIFADICDMVGSHLGDHRATPRVSPAAHPAPCFTSILPRRHVVRIAAHPALLTVDHILHAARNTPLDELALARGRARLLTAPTSDQTARNLAETLGGQSLILPLLEEAPRS